MKVIKVVVISDGKNFNINNFQMTFVQMKDLPYYKEFFKSEDLDSLYQQRDKKYFTFLENFQKNFHEFDILICDQLNPFHPEWLYNNLKHIIKIYGMIDDPVCTYHRTLSQIWAFDGVFYVSPGYNEKFTMNELIKSYNSRLETFFLPHARNNKLTQAHLDTVNKSFNKRNEDVLYVGAYYESKIERLIFLKNKLGDKFNVYGNWPYKGFRGILRGLELKTPFFQRVKYITEREKFDLFLKHKICFNMNWNEGRETGNMRMYQAPFYGMMLLCDQSAKNQHEVIFNKDEAIFYDCIEDAVEKIDYYLKNDSERIRIAKNGFKRAVNDYNHEKIWIDILNWSLNIYKS